MARAARRRSLSSKVTSVAGGVWLVRALGAYVLLQLGWWAYLLSRTGGEREQWMVIGEGTVFALLLIIGLRRLERNIRREQLRLARERNMLLGVTHELKTPLASVQLGVDTLRRMSLSESDRSEVLSNMQSGIHDLERRVEDMLVATRLQRQSGVKATTFDWVEAMHEGWQRLESLGEGRMVWDSERDAEDVQAVRGDRGLWTLVATNLIENALKYSEGLVRVRAFQTKELAVLEVEDQGNGIPFDDMESAIAPFVRLQEQGAGTGLGLHLVAQTAELHGATLEMNSIQPEGFLVRVAWPQRPARETTFAT